MRGCRTGTYSRRRTHNPLRDEREGLDPEEAGYELLFKCVICCAPFKWMEHTGSYRVSERSQTPRIALTGAADPPHQGRHVGVPVDGSSATHHGADRPEGPGQ
jgi:hypothetical protein